MSASSDPLRKGWCPGALRPMAARDGLLVRLRITGGIVPAAMAWALADCAERHGNGLFDLSARGNLQMRGVTEVTMPALLDRLGALALLDADADGEAVRNVVASPLAGCAASSADRGGHGSHPDIRPITAALERRLAGDRALHALPTKFGFLVDDGGAPSLAGVAADVRFDWVADDARFKIGLGGTRGTAVVIGSCGADDLVASAVRVATGALALLAKSDARRMRQLVQAFGAARVARACGGERREPPAPCSLAAPEVVGEHTFAGLPVLGLAAPFGRLDAAMLRHAAALADSAAGEIRLTPWRAMLIPGAGRGMPPVERGLALDHARAGFIVAEGDPRRAVAACVGRDGCARGTTRTHADATALADLAAGFGGRAIALHVSGCEKGCAKPSATALTLVGRDGRYDLVRDGRAGDPPVAHGLDLAAARRTLAGLLEPA